METGIQENSNYEEKEMQALINAVDLDFRTGVRDKGLLLLLYNTGARVSEIVQLKLPDLRLDGVAQVNLLGKGKKYRSCPLWTETLEALHDYLQQLARFGVRHIIGKYAAEDKSQSSSLASPMAETQCFTVAKCAC